MIAGAMSAFVSPQLAHAQGCNPGPAQKPGVPYCLFPTDNIYTFLKLDTRTGQVWQVQWGKGPEYRWVQPINPKPLSDEKQVGRFTLYPTKNIYTFILMDQEDGRQWQIQWGDGDSRLFIPLYCPPEARCVVEP